jgi:hypothetical protein
VVSIELVALLAQAEENNAYPTRYDLVANICHEGKPNTGTYKYDTRHVIIVITITLSFPRLFRSSYPHAFPIIVIEYKYSIIVVIRGMKCKIYMCGPQKPCHN